MNGNMDTNPCSLTSQRVSNGGDSPDGLKFGKKIYFEYLGHGVSSKPDVSCGGSSSPSSLSLPAIPVIKKTKPSRCQVEGCRVDLTGGKAYYCRHKVCAMHSKSPKVIVDGIEQRFCQQCSSCLNSIKENEVVARRLAGHNERRRKPPSGSPSSCFDWLPYFQENSSKADVPPETFPYSRFPVRDPWEIVRAGESASASRYSHPPNILHCSSESPAFHALYPRMNGLTVGSAFPGIPPGQSLAGSNDFGCALSLLSPQIFPAPYRAQQGVSAQVANNQCSTMNNASMGNSWNDDRCNGATSNTLDEEAPGGSDLGLTSASHRININQPRYAEIEHEHLNGFTLSQLQMPWSL